MLGASRLWIELPLLALVALLLLVQGIKLTIQPVPTVPRRIDAIDLSVLLFVLYAIVREWTVSTAYFPRIEALAVVAYAGVFLTCRYGMANRRYCMGLLYLLVILGVGETAFGYYLSNHLDWFPFGPAEQRQLFYAPLWLGTYENPNHYAGLLVMAIGAALALGSFSKLPWPARIVLIYLSVMMVVGVIYSGSRGSWIALAAAIGALVTIGLRNGTMRWWVPISGTLVLVAVIGLMFSLSPVVHERLADAHSLISGDRLDTDGRIQQTKTALGIAHDHLLFGTGPGTFVFIHPDNPNGAEPAKPEPFQDDYLNCLDNYGLVGLGLALFFVGAVTLKFFRPLIVDNRWQDRVLVATGFAAWMALLVHSLVDDNLHIPANALLLFSLTGLALGRIQEEKKPHWSTLLLSPLGRWLGVAVIVLSLVYGIETARMALSDLAYEQAFARHDTVPINESITATEAALRYDPGNVQASALLQDLQREQILIQKDVQAHAPSAESPSAGTVAPP